MPSGKTLPRMETTLPFCIDLSSLLFLLLISEMEQKLQDKHATTFNF